MTHLKGVGPKRAGLLAQKGLHTILDLLFFTPVRYEDRTRISPINFAKEGVPVVVRGRVLSGREERFYSSRKRLYKIVIDDGSGELELLWFRYRQPHMNSLAAPDKVLLAYGIIKTNRDKRQMIHPEIACADSNLGFYPVYPTVKGITPKLLRSLIMTTLDDYSADVFDPVPAKITHRLALPEL